MMAIQQKTSNRIILGLHTTLGPLLPARKYLKLMAVLVLGVLGYLVGPRDLPLGNYSVEIGITLDDHTLSIVHLFLLGVEEGPLILDTQTDGAYQLVLKAKDAYQSGLGQSISYRLQVVNAGGQPVHLALDNVTSTISGVGYRSQGKSVG
jgi:hypothetical protein